jgi:hypothetical protein
MAGTSRHTDNERRLKIAFVGVGVRAGNTLVFSSGR